MPTPKLPIGCGMHRARRNRKKKPQPAVTGGMGLVTIHFEDQGQDFLRWTVTEHGDVLECEPFQSGIWSKARIVNRAELAVGVRPVYKFPGVDRELTLKYRIIAIHDAFDVAAEEAVKASTSKVVLHKPANVGKSQPLVMRKLTIKGGRS